MTQPDEDQDLSTPTEPSTATPTGPPRGQAQVARLVRLAENLFEIGMSFPAGPYCTQLDSTTGAAVERFHFRAPLQRRSIAGLLSAAYDADVGEPPRTAAVTAAIQTLEGKARSQPADQPKQDTADRPTQEDQDDTIGVDDFPMPDDGEDQGEDATVTDLPTQRQQLKALAAPVPDDYTIPQPYLLMASGVHRLHTKEHAATGTSTEVLEQVASAPCLVTGALRDDEGEELVELAWRHRRTWQRRTVPRAVMRSGRRLVTALGDAGFPVMDGSARKMETWLDAVEAANRDRLPVTTIARTLGWQPKGAFVTADGVPYPVHLRIGGMEPAVAAHHPAGTLETWQGIIKALEPYPVAQMGLYAAWAAPLLKVLGLDSFTVDLSGLTTTGKTTTLEVGLSVWADPHLGMAQWNATRIAIENRLALVNGMLVAVDETTAAERPETIRDVIYTVPRNRGKDRGSLDGSRPALAFHAVLLTSGERPILSFTKDGGMAARVLEITGAPFGPAGGDDARDVREGVYAHYGTAGAAFTGRLTAALEADGGRRNIQSTHRTARSAFATGTALNRRRAPLLAALWVAAQLARQWEVLPFDPPPVDTWRDVFDRPESADDRPGEALQVVRNWRAANPHRLYPYIRMIGEKVDTGPPLHGWAGKTEDDGGFALRPEIVREVLDKEGYELDAVKAAWADRGAIRREREGGNLTRKRSLDGASARLFVFAPESGSWSDDEPPPPDEPPEDEEDGP